jgi:hypothetical protein
MEIKGSERKRERLRAKNIDTQRWKQSKTNEFENDFVPHI